MLNLFPTKLLLLITCVPTLKAQLNDCQTIPSFLEKHRSHVQENFDFTPFLSDPIPDDKETTGLDYISKGAFGAVFNIDLKLKDLTSTTGALKVIKYQANKTTELDNELFILQKMSNIHPLYMSRYFTCVVNNEEPSRLFIFTEKLDFSLDKKEFKNIFKQLELKKKIGLMLMMAISVFNFHSYEFGHFDIKPANFMYLASQPPIIKIIDYGLVSDFKGYKKKGSPNYIDIQMAKSDYKQNPLSDIYSLGITFHEILYNQSEMKLTSMDIFKNMFQARTFNQDRISRAVEKHKEIENLDINEGDKDKFIVLHELIRNMIATEFNARPDIKKVVQSLDDLLKELDEESIYRVKNMNSLFEAIFKNELNNNLPLIKEQNPLVINSNQTEGYNNSLDNSVEQKTTLNVLLKEPTNSKEKVKKEEIVKNVIKQENKTIFNNDKFRNVAKNKPVILASSKSNNIQNKFAAIKNNINKVPKQKKYNFEAVYRNENKDLLNKIKQRNYNTNYSKFVKPVGGKYYLPVNAKGKNQFILRILADSLSTKTKRVI